MAWYNIGRGFIITWVVGSIYHRQGFWYIRVITKLPNSEQSYKRYTMGARGYNTIYRDLIYNGQKGMGRAKAISKGFDITWVGGQYLLEQMLVKYIFMCIMKSRFKKWLSLISLISTQRTVIFLILTELAEYKMTTK